MIQGTEIQANDKVVLKENFDFYLNGVGLIVPEHGKVYCVEATRKVNFNGIEEESVYLVGKIGTYEVDGKLEKNSFEARCFKKLGN